MHQFWVARLVPIRHRQIGIGGAGLFWLNGSSFSLLATDVAYTTSGVLSLSVQAAERWTVKDVLARIDSTPTNKLTEKVKSHDYIGDQKRVVRRFVLPHGSADSKGPWRLYQPGCRSVKLFALASLVPGISSFWASHPGDLENPYHTPFHPATSGS